MARKYWIEDGVDKGYRQKIANKIAMADATNEATLNEAENELKKKGYSMEDNNSTKYLLYVGIAVGAWFLLRKKPTTRRYATYYRKRRTTYNKLKY